jgi:hypothetical protein
VQGTAAGLDEVLRGMPGRWLGRGRMSFPIVLSNAHIRRIVDRNATVLILTSRKRLGVHACPELYEIHNRLVLKQNARDRRNSKPEWQTDPCALIIELRAVTEATLGGLDFRQARLAGYRTVEELREDWAIRREKLGGDAKVFVHEFAITDARFLHRRSQRGYSTDPAQGMRDEPEGVDAATQKRLTELGTFRWQQERDRRGAQAQAVELHERVRELERRYAGGEASLEPDLRVIRQRIQALQRNLPEVA